MSSKRKSWSIHKFGLRMKAVTVSVLATMPFLGLPDMALALPHGGVVSKGNATLSYSTNKLLIHQSTKSATFDWSSYMVKINQSVWYQTPGSSSVSLNIIGGTSPAAISGKVTSNGTLEFMDKNGIIFGQGSTISAAGVMAFGSQTPWGSPTGPVTNAGAISLPTGGTVVLAGTSVSNSGTIESPGGMIALVSGATIKPIYSGTSFSLSAVSTTGGGTVTDSGIIFAETVGGQTGKIVLQSGMNSGTTTLVPSAVLDASSPTRGKGGVIETSGSRVNVANGALVTTDASNGDSGTWILDPASFYIGMNTGSANNTKGNVLNYEDISGSELGTLLGSGNIVIDSTSGIKGNLGNIYINDPISWASTNSLTLNAVNSIEINNSIKNTVTGYSNTQTITGGTITSIYPNNPLLVLRADDMDLVGTTSNTTGGGVPSGNGTVVMNSGGTIDVNGPLNIYYNPINFSTPTTFSNSGSGTVRAYMLLSANADLYYIDQNQTSQILSNNYALNKNISLPIFGSSSNSSSDNQQISLASSTNGISSPSSSTYSNWIRFGGFSAGGYLGNFDGLNHSISNMTIYDTNHISSGFFGYTRQNTIDNFGISSGSIYASNTAVNYYKGGYGGFAGIAADNSVLINDFSKVNVNGAAWGGGFVGQLCPTSDCGGTQAGVVIDSYSTGSVTNNGSLGYTDTGGFVGDNEGAIYNSYETGNVTGQNTMGGFAGIVSGNGYPSLIMNSYATGNVKGGTYVGGFVGYDRGPGQIIDGFSTGTVTGSSSAGGFSGNGGNIGSGNPVVTNSYWNKTTSNVTTSYNGTGLTSSQFTTKSNFSGWGFNTWGGSAWQNSTNTDPWTMGSIGPVLIPDMPVESIEGKSGASIYTGGTISPGFTLSATQGASPVTTGISTSVGPNVGSYLNTPIASTFSAPATQTSIGTFNISSGIYIISPAPLSLSTTVSQIYNGGALTSLTSSNANLVGIVSGQTTGAELSTPVTGTLVSSNVGINLGGSVTLSISDLSGNSNFNAALAAGDYTLPTTFTGGTITALPVTATAISNSMTYGGTVPSVTGTLTPTNGSLVNLSATWSTPATSTSPAGSYAITPTFSYATGAVAGDFSITSATGNTTAMTVNPASLTFTGGSITNLSKVYDGTTTATLTPSNSSATLNGFKNGQDATYTGATGTYASSNAGTGINVSATLGTGNFSTSGSGFSWSNYSLPTMTLSGTGTISPLSVTATAISNSMTYGGTVPSVTGTLTPTNGSLVNLSATWSTPATSTSPAGSYAITPTFSYATGAVAGDFSITSATGNTTAMTITPPASTNSLSVSISNFVPEIQTVEPTIEAAITTSSENLPQAFIPTAGFSFPSFVLEGVFGNPPLTVLGQGGDWSLRIVKLLPDTPVILGAQPTTGSLSEIPAP